MAWPYGPPPEPFLESLSPTWRCPEDICQCHPIKGDGNEEEVSIVLLASDGERMRRAACQVHYQGRVIEDAQNADGDGRVKLKLPRVPTTLLVEWAPEDTPLDPRYPYRALYHVDLGHEPRDKGRRRLANLGFWTARTLEDNVREFQRCYDNPKVSGELSDIQSQLDLYHDHGCPPIVKESRSGGEAAAFTPQDAQQGTGGNIKAPQPPLAPAPHQGSLKVPSIEVDIIVEWGVHPARVGKSAQQVSSFWLEPTASPVAIGIVQSAAGGWPTATTTPVAFTRTTKTSVTARLPPGPVLLRLDFDLQTTISGNTKTVLAFRQTYYLEGNGDLVPLRFAFEEYTYQKGQASSPPKRVTGKGFRRGRGRHPLLWHETDLLPDPSPKKTPRKKPTVARRTKRVFVNAEMVDATELWWAVHSKEDISQYLNPALKGRPEFLRVLAWTSGKLPMIWFAIVPDAALANTERPAADIVYIRPPPGANSFPYTPNAKGFTASQHTATTMQMLARYVLASQPLATLQAAGVTDAMTLRAFADQIFPNDRNASGNPDPAHPAPFISYFPTSFRPCWLEDSMNRAGAPHLLLLPLGTPDHGYPGTAEPGLKTVVESAFLCLWNQCAIARDLPSTDSLLPFGEDPDPVQTPSVQARKLWLVGHSRGNTLMASALATNARDVERVLTFSATPASNNLEPLIGILRTAAATRKSAGKKLDVFVITAPDLTHDWDLQTQSKGSGKSKSVSATRCRGASMDPAHARLLVATGADVTFLPAFADQRKHYTLAPATSMNQFLRNLLAQWGDDSIAESAATPNGWEFLFFHEYPVFAGDLDTSTTPATVRTFFLQALGSPSPLTTPPTALPP